MRAGSAAHFTPLPVPECAVCSGVATTKIVPTRATRRGRTSGTIQVTTMRLCESCRREVTSGRITLGWSAEGERWGPLGTRSPSGDTYLQHDP
jgi:hypothetical protein